MGPLWEDATLDRFVLRKLGLDAAQAMAAVAPDDLDNIAVAVAARAVAPDLRVVIRAATMRPSPRPGPCAASASSTTSPA
ncbi:NAD-binding protein [Streptomyces sp. NPDC048825]|uniref:NAD-binding protein n=1 Tax=Streptomyces sp. NPDC048825 TaxID=3365592 RepID=UPI0037102172